MRTLVVCCALCVATSASATTLLFDFGNVNQLSPEAPNTPAWNNVLRPDDGGTPVNIVDTQGNLTTVGLIFTDPFFINGPPSQLGSEAPSGDAAVYPVAATDDYFFGHTGAFAGEPDNSVSSFTIFGLDPNTAYDFTFFSSRGPVGDNRETAYSLSGANSGNGLAATSNNDTEVLRINGITPNVGGTIDVSVSAGPNNDNGQGFYYMNLMQIDSQVIPEPSAAVICLAAICAASLGRQGRR